MNSVVDSEIESFGAQAITVKTYIQKGILKAKKVCIIDDTGNLITSYDVLVYQDKFAVCSVDMVYYIAMDELNQINEERTF